jgi:hypothetical protein
MTLTILSVEKTGSIKEIQLKTFNEAELYKKAGFKTEKDFKLQTEWGAELNGKKYTVSLYGKTDGRAGQENKYEFPPPVDSVLFFGACLLVNKCDGELTNITKEEWKLAYEHLYGGFEDIGDEDSEESEDDVDSDVPRTKEGYVKDDFVVEDDEDYEETTSEEEIVTKKKSKKTVEKKPLKEKKEKVVLKKGKTTKEQTKTAFTKVEEIENESYFDCTDELLVEEEYI